MSSMQRPFKEGDFVISVVPPNRKFVGIIVNDNFIFSNKRWIGTVCLRLDKSLTPPEVFDSGWVKQSENSSERYWWVNISNVKYHDNNINRIYADGF